MHPKSIRLVAILATLGALLTQGAFATNIVSFTGNFSSDTDVQFFNFTLNADTPNRLFSLIEANLLGHRPQGTGPAKNSNNVLRIFPPQPQPAVSAAHRNLFRHASSQAEDLFRGQASRTRTRRRRPNREDSYRS